MAETEQINILGVRVDAINPELALERIRRWIQNRDKVYVCIAPVSTIVDCQENQHYRQIVNEAGMVTPDGMPLVWIARHRGYDRVRRTYGPDLMLRVCSQGQAQEYKHYFYGGAPEVNEKLSQRLKAKFPDIKIVGRYSPPFRAAGERESEQVLAQINTAKPDILWVGLGSPKQDLWMHQHRDRLDVPVMIGVGAAFDFLSGEKKQAPIWMRKAGLEWLFRLLCEPRRLWRRYLFGNTKFIWFIVKEYFTKRA